jgi:hypothetical protein
MQLAEVTTIEGIRMAERQFRDGPVLRRLWHAMRCEWQRGRDRAMANAVAGHDHLGTTEDFWAVRRAHPIGTAPETCSRGSE